MVDPPEPRDQSDEAAVSDLPHGATAPITGQVDDDAPERESEIDDITDSMRRPAGAAGAGDVDDFDSIVGEIDYSDVDVPALLAEREEYKGMAQRVQADFDNYRKRAAAQSLAEADRASGRLAEALLPVLDAAEAAFVRHPDEIGPLLNENFDLRRRLYRISAGNLAMVETARACGASAKFTGSGGAIVGTYQDEAMFKRLQQELAAQEVVVIQPQITPQPAP